MNETARAGIWFTVCNFLQKGISFITIPIFTRAMSTEEYGYTTLFNTWSGILIIFATLNLSGSVYNRGLMEFDHKRFTSIIQTISTVFTLFLFIIVMMFKDFFVSVTDLNTIILILMLVYFIFEPGLSFWSVKERFKYKYKKLVIVTLLNTIISTGVALITVFFSTKKGENKVIAQTITLIVIALPFYIRNFVEGKVFFDKKIWKYVLVFALPLVPHYLSNIILNQSDKIMINMYCGKTYVALYGVAYAVGSILRILLDAVNATLTPWRYQNMKKKNYDGINRVSIKILALIAIAVAVANLFAPEILLIFGNSKYQEAIWVIPPVMLSIYYIFLYGLFSCIEFYFLETKFMMVASIASAIINILLNYFFIGIFGYVACAYTTLICYMLYCLFHYLYMIRVCRKNIGGYKIYNMKNVTIISVVCTVITLVSAIMYNNTVLRYCLILFVLASVFMYRKKIIELLKEVKT